MTTAKSPGAVTARGASEMDGLVRHVISEASPHHPVTQDPISARLIGSDRCEAERIIARSSAPVLALCRELVAAGFHPASSLEAWRGDMLCIRIASIGEAAQFTVEDDRHGRPRLRRWRDGDRGCGGGPPLRQNASVLVRRSSASNPFPAHPMRRARAES